MCFFLGFCFNIYDFMNMNSGIFCLKSLFNVEIHQQYKLSLRINGPTYWYLCWNISISLSDVDSDFLWSTAEKIFHAIISLNISSLSWTDRIYTAKNMSNVMFCARSRLSLDIYINARYALKRNQMKHCSKSSKCGILSLFERSR